MREILNLVSYTNPEPNAVLLPVEGRPFKIIISLELDFVIVIWTTEYSTFWKISDIAEDDGVGEGVTEKEGVVNCQ